MRNESDVDTAKELPTVISFCSGYGGLERGLELAGVEHRVLCYVEIEAHAQALLVKSMEQGDIPPAPIYSDLTTFPSHIFRGSTSLITAGYPCQPFSQSGKRQGADDEQGRHLWPFIREHIRAIEPAGCFFENVYGHISLGLSTVISDLEEDGYKVEAGIFSAVEVGADQGRKRVYIQAHIPNTMRERGRSGDTQREDAADAGELPRGSWDYTRGVGHWDSEPSMGRVAHGVAHRTDRLRLLGNGVVPQTAALAWSVLSQI